MPDSITAGGGELHQLQDAVGGSAVTTWPALGSVTKTTAGAATPDQAI